MKRWILVSCLLEICSAMPYARHYTYADPFHIWMHNFLPSHSSPPYWGKRRLHEHDTQQYEYTMPVHPPPLPSQQTPLQQTGLQEQFPFLLTNQIPYTTRQVQLQQYEIQPPFLQPEGHHPVVPQLLPQDRQTQQLPFQEYSGTLGQTIYPSFPGTPQDPVQQPQQRSVYPNLFYLPYVANQGVPGAPARLGIVSSEEMQGGGLGATAYRAMSPNLFSMGSGFGNPPQNRLGQPGDYTVEDDQLGITEQPDIAGGANPSGNGNNGVSVNGNNLGGALSNINSNLMNPAGQSKGPAGLPQATISPLATQGLSDSFVPFEADTPMPLDPTMSPDVLFTPQTGYEAGQPQIGQDGWHFQEP
ncbi:ameloblastin isoform X1 [Sphaerodactylus townsendi]|uniref:ameloblastin isoform X1 n=1 Tax=Sphaerodactylus townsendi TaxID=933632 RepID=UPI002025FA59|nr:ameloblastin isoform X1 [Sphaerodactylus townsendi]